MAEVKCLNPWDSQSKRQYQIDGVYRTLDAGNRAGGQTHGICYEAEVLPINLMVVTRGGKDDMRTCFGIGEEGDPQFTLSAAHEHGVCYAIEENTADRASDDAHAICFQLCGDRDNPSVSTSDKAYCIPANPMSDRGQAVCYSVDCRNLEVNPELSATLQTKETGGWSLNYLNPVMYENEE